MTTPTSMGNHGGTVTSCSPYAYPGFAKIRILLRTWSTVVPGTYELAFWIKIKKKLCGKFWQCTEQQGLRELFMPLRELFGPSVNFLGPSVNYFTPP